jgi:thiol-disulfide isomerase/thioredoxin
MLEQIQSGAYDLITSTRFWMIMAVIIFFIVIAIYLYYTYVTPMVDKKFIPNSEYRQEDAVGESQEAELLFFTVDWCPHSKKAIPIWDELKAEYGGTTYNGYKLNFVQINGEENPDMADKYKVDGYPTIKLVKGNQVIEYDAKPTLENLKEFLNSTLS